MKSFKKTHIMLRVFFVVACVSLFGILIAQHRQFTTQVKVQGGSFSEGLIGSPRFINPVLVQSQTDKDLTKLVFGSLLFIQNDEINYQLAQSLDISKDHTEYTLELKNNLFFHNGEHITADDLLFTIEKIQDPLIKSPLAIRWEGVSVEKLNTYTVKFVLAKSYADFPHNLDIGILPKSLWKDASPEEFIFSLYNTNPVGSGFYEVTHIEKGSDGIAEYYVLKNKKNTHAAYITKIIIHFFENEESRIKAYNEGIIDTLYGASQHQDKLSVGNDVRQYSGTLPRVFGIFFNQGKNQILENKYLRDAILKSVDIQTITEKVFLSDALYTNNPLGIAADTQTYNPTEAQKILENNQWQKNEQGVYVKDGKVLEFTLSIPNVEDFTLFAEYMQTNLQEHGISMNIKSFDQGELAQNIIRPRDYEAIFFGYMIAKKSDLYAFWHSSQKNDPGLNISLYSNKNVDKILQETRIGTNDFKKDEIINEITQDIPALFLYSPTYNYIVPKHIQGTDIVVTQDEDRFNTIQDWYIKTRHVWNIFVSDTPSE
jgi:peptide/nickel transport system substrate-binding protein